MEKGNNYKTKSFNLNVLYKENSIINTTLKPTKDLFQILNAKNSSNNKPTSTTFHYLFIFLFLV
jgi:hypothetical protein